MYSVYKIDITNTYPFADVFEESKSELMTKSRDLDRLFKNAIRDFFKLNANIKDWDDWTRQAENGAYEIEIHNPEPIFKTSLLLVDPMVKAGAELALQYHTKQKRKAGGRPYLSHILEVANILRLINREHPNREMLAAAFCHDLLEDTKCTEAEIESACGKEVLSIVKALTNDKALNLANKWTQKKTKYINAVKAAGEKAMQVSLADGISNLKSLLELKKTEGRNVWINFNRGKERKVWFDKSVLEMLEANIKNKSLIEEYRMLINQEDN